MLGKIKDNIKRRHGHNITQPVIELWAHSLFPEPCLASHSQQAS